MHPSVCRYVYTYVHIVPRAYLLSFSSLDCSELGKNLKNYLFQSPSSAEKGMMSQSLGKLASDPQLGFEPNQTRGIGSLRVTLKDTEYVFL